MALDNFEKAVGYTLQFEGGFSQNPNDPGNWTGGEVGKGELVGTNYGISAASFPNLNIKSLTLDQAKALYKQEYWDVIKGDSLPFPLSMFLFDYAVNSGVYAAVSSLQQVLFVTVDGIVGPETIEAAQKFDQDILLSHVATFRIMRVMHLNTSFLQGLLNRVSKLLLICGGYLGIRNSQS